MKKILPAKSQCTGQTLVPPMGHKLFITVGGCQLSVPNCLKPNPRALESLVHLEATKTVELLKRQVVNNEGHAEGDDLKTSYFLGRSRV